MITAVDCLAVYRLTRLAQRDTLPVVANPRRAIMESPKTPDAVIELMECPWCLSFWIGLGVVILRRSIPRLWDPIATALAASAVAGMLSEREQD